MVYSVSPFLGLALIHVCHGPLYFCLFIREVVRGRPLDSLISTSYLVRVFISFLCSHFHRTILVTPPFVVVLVPSPHISFLGHVSDDYVCCPDLVVIVRLGSDRQIR
jgi:hypothetical protein